MPRRMASGSVGQASINRRRSGSAAAFAAALLLLLLSLLLTLLGTGPEVFICLAQVPQFVI